MKEKTAVSADRICGVGALWEGFMLGIYNYTVILTYVGMLAGFNGIIAAVDGNILISTLCLMFAGICDMLDGRVASTMERTRQEKQFGIQIDSLSDLVSFGILPPLILYQCSSSRLIIGPCALYALCALIRLAWYNVDEMERQDRESGPRSVYSGLPVTFASLIFPAVIGLCTKLHISVQWIGSIVLLITAVAFLTPFQMRKLLLRRSR